MCWQLLACLRILLSVSLAFSAAVGIWTVGYLGRFPGMSALSAVLEVIFLLRYLALGGLAEGCSFLAGQAALGRVLAFSINLLDLGSWSVEGSGPRLAVAIPGLLTAACL